MKKQEKTFIGLAIFLISLILIISGINELSYNNEQTEKKCFITLKKFNQIKIDMTLEEVENIIGCSGIVLSENQIGEYHTIIYCWYGENEIANANFTFQNNKLLSKAQLGLK